MSIDNSCTGQQNLQNVVRTLSTLCMCCPVDIRCAYRCSTGGCLLREVKTDFKFATYVKKYLERVVDNKLQIKYTGKEEMLRYSPAALYFVQSNV